MAIGVIGRVDPALVDGQTIKTRALVQELEKTFPQEEIVVADVSSWKAHPMLTLSDVRQCMGKCTDIFVLLSSNGRRVIFPLICRMNRRLHRRIYHDVIGTGPIKDARESEKAAKQMQSFTCNWVETFQGVESLKACGVTNACYLPNFKDLEPADLASLPVRTRPPYLFCTFSRVTKDKGVDDAIWAVEELAGTQRLDCRLDIYGPIDPAFKEELEQLLAVSPHASYGGVKRPEESVAVMSGYDALLFPTRHPTEGIPGTVIDALFAGLPIVASQWPCYHQMLEDGVTGYSYPIEHREELLSAILKLLRDPEASSGMRKRCQERSEEYSAPHAMSLIVSRMRSEGFQA